MSKYRAVPTVVDGVRFASKAEARRYATLRVLARAGQIRDLELQPAFALHVAGTKIGTYRADFRYRRRDGAVVVEDVKGVLTPMYRWKKKHLRAEHGIEVNEVAG